jgi:hypothetical protein
MSDRATKLRRLAANARTPHTVLCEIVNHLLTCPELLEKKLDRQALRRSIEKVWDQVGYREDVACYDGSSFSWDCTSLPKLLQLLVKSSANFRNVVRQTWEAHPCTREEPWHLIVYGDEVVPGNVLRLDNKRKFFAVYVTVKEFGPAYLKHEHLWLPVAIIRSSVAKDRIPGNLSGCMKLLFRKWFLTDRIDHDGVLLDLDIPDSRYANVYLKLGNVVADGDAYRAIWSAKGASGKLPCLLCKNILSQRTNSVYLQHFSCPYADRFDLATNEEVWEKADKIAASRLGGGHARLQVMYGMTDSPSGLLWDLQLREHVRPVDVITFDSMHCLVSNGIAQFEVSLMLDALMDLGVTWVQLRNFAASDWKFSSALGSSHTLRGCLAPAREKAYKKEGSFKAGASEMLLVSPVLQFFLHKVIGVPSQMTDQIASFDALNSSLRLVNLIKQGFDVTRQLADSLKAHALAFEKAYPEANAKPKTHYVLHVPGQVVRDGVLLDAFVGERKHGGMKRQADGVKNTVTFEHTIISRAVCSQLSWLEDPANLADGLIAPSDSPGLATLERCSAAAVSSAMAWTGTRICIGDCLLLNDIVHILEACAALDGDLAVVTSRYAKVGQVIRKPVLLHSFGDEALAANITKNESCYHSFWVVWGVGYSQQPKPPRTSGRMIRFL